MKGNGLGEQGSSVPKAHLLHSQFPWVALLVAFFALSPLVILLPSHSQAISFTILHVVLTPVTVVFSSR